MIQSLTIADRADAVLPWARELAYFQAHPVTTFQPGLNIVFGANGSGKSTLLRLLGLTLAAVQGGSSTVTESWLREVFKFGDTPLLPCSVVHDGQPVLYHDGREAVGLVAGGAAFDEDFFMQGVAACQARGSVGELSMRRATRLFQVLAKARGNEVEHGFPLSVDWRVVREGAQGRHGTRVRAVEELLAARCPVGPKTLLFDEPESGFSMPWQDAVWRNLFSTVDPAQYQVIIATHSPFALAIPGAHYIEMSPAYADTCLVTLCAALKQKAPGLF